MIFWNDQAKFLKKKCVTRVCEMNDYYRKYMKFMTNSHTYKYFFVNLGDSFFGKCYDILKCQRMFGFLKVLLGDRNYGNIGPTCFLNMILNQLKFN